MGRTWRDSRECERSGECLNPHSNIVTHLAVSASMYHAAKGYIKKKLWLMNQIRHLRQSLSPLSLRLIHSGRLLTDGILLVPWLRSLEDRLRRQASTMGGDVESVLKEVGLAEDGDATSTSSGPGGSGVGDKGKEERVWLHCIVGGKLDEKKPEAGDEEEVSQAHLRNIAKSEVMGLD